MTRWVPVKGYEGYYEVSDDGQVKSLERRVRCRNGTRLARGVVLKQKIDRYGYRVVTLQKNRKSIWRTVHSLVLAAFIGDRPSGYHGCHKNSDKSDNRLENLRWDTPKGNAKDKLDAMRQAYGDRVNHSRLKKEQVLSIRKRASEGEKYRPLAREFGVSDTAIRKICTGENWKYLGDK